MAISTASAAADIFNIANQSTAAFMTLCTREKDCCTKLLSLLCTEQDCMFVCVLSNPQAQARTQGFRNTEVQKLSLIYVNFEMFGEQKLDDSSFKTMSVSNCINYLSSRNT